MDAQKKSEFEAYFETYYSQVRKYILKKIGNNEVAEDIAMDAFASAYYKFENFDENKASFATWIYVIVNNKLKNYYRDHKVMDELDDSYEALSVFEDDIVASEYLSSMRTELAKALKTLTLVQQKIVVYKYFREMNAVEIAKILGVTSGSVRVNLSRALNKLKQYFDNNDIKWED